MVPGMPDRNSSPASPAAGGVLGNGHIQRGGAGNHAIGFDRDVAKAAGEPDDHAMHAAHRARSGWRRRRSRAPAPRAAGLPENRRDPAHRPARTRTSAGPPTRNHVTGAQLRVRLHAATQRGQAFGQMRDLRFAHHLPATPALRSSLQARQLFRQRIRPGRDVAGAQAHHEVAPTGPWRAPSPPDVPARAAAPRCDGRGRAARPPAHRASRRGSVASPAA